MEATYHLHVVLDVRRPDRERTALALRLTSIHHRRGVTVHSLHLGRATFTTEFDGTSQQAHSIVRSLDAVVGVTSARLTPVAEDQRPIT